MPSVLLLFIGIFLIRFWPFLLGKTLIFGDTFSYYVPGKLFTASSLREGILPTWNPYVLGGISWIGDLNQSLFSFSTALFTFFQPVGALNLTIFLNLAIGFFGMYWLGVCYTRRRFGGAVAGTAWMFSGIVSTTMGNPSILQTLVWLPWILIGTKLDDQKKGFILTTFALVMGILGGYPQLLPYGLFLSVASSMVWERSAKQLLWWGGVIAMSLLLTSFVTIPFFKSLRSSTRVLQTAEQSAEGKLHPIDLVSVFLPNVFVNEQQGIKWGPQWNTMSHTVLFVPWIFWLFALRNRKKIAKQSEIRFFLLMTIIALVLAMTNLIAYVPLIKFARGPSHALSIITLTIPLLMASILAQPDRARLFRDSSVRLLVPVFLSIVIVIGLLANFGRIWNLANTLSSNRLKQSAFHTVPRDYHIAKNMMLTVLLHMLLSTVLYLSWRTRRLAIFLIALALQCHSATASALFFAPGSVYPTWQEIREKQTEYTMMTSGHRVLFTNGNAPYTDFASYTDALTVRAPFSDSFVDIQELEDFNHLRSMRQTLTPNWNMVYRIPAINGYVALLPMQIDKAFRRSGEMPLLNTLPAVATGSAVLSQWDVTYVVVDPWYPTVATFDEHDLVGQFGRAKVYKLKQTD